MSSAPGHVPNKLVEVPEPGIMFTRSNAMWAYHGLKAARSQGCTVPEQDELCNELEAMLFPPRPPEPTHATA